MRTFTWLALREVAHRRVRFVVAVAVVAALVALAVGVEVMSRARDGAVGARVDQIGAPLRLVARGVSAVDLARFEAPLPRLPRAALDGLRVELAPWTRSQQGRLLALAPSGAARIPTVGVESGDRELTLAPDEVALGPVLAERLHVAPGGLLRLWGASLRVRTVLPRSDGPDDTSAFVPIAQARSWSGQHAATTVLALYPSDAEARARVEAVLAARLPPDVSVLRTDRGTVAEQDLGDALVANREVVFAVGALVVAVCLLLFGHLDAGERRGELAALAAIGTTSGGLAALLSLRAAAVGAAGGTAGFGLGAVTAAVTDPGAAWDAVSPGLAAATIGVSAALAVLAGLPVALRAAWREHVAELQT